ncbi:MAG: hypothetical protein ABSC08_03170 [Bryobacteraceae bacterium]
MRGKSADIMWLDDWRKTQADIRIAMHLLRYWKDFQKVERFVSFPGGRGFQYARKTGGKFVRFDIWIDQDGTLYNEDERFGDRLDYSRLHYMGAAGHIADLAQMTQEAATNWPLTAARATLAKLVSKGMADCVAPWIAPSSGNVFQQHISARNLAGHLWLQIYFAMTGESVLRACEKCGGIMDVLGEGGRANRRYHPRCYKAVEMQRYRLRQRAQKGRAPKHASASGRPLRRV